MRLLGPLVDRAAAPAARSDAAFDAAASSSVHLGPKAKRAGFGVPEGFVPDPKSGYYYSAESGYYFDASSKLYFHGTTQQWYSSDPITGQLRPYFAPAAAPAAAAPAAAAPAAAADGAAATVASGDAAAEAAAPAAAPAVVPLEDNHKKVVLGLGIGKGLGGKAKKAAAPALAKPAAFAVADADDDGAGGTDAARPLLHHHAQAAERKRQEQRSAEAALVDWAGLICQLCKRRLKDRPTLQKHVDESALHQTNLAAWRDERAAAATAAAAAAAEADRREIRSERPRDDHRGKPEVSAQDRVVKVGGATFKVPSGTPAPRDNRL